MSAGPSSWWLQAVLQFVVLTWSVTAILGQLISLQVWPMLMWRTGLAAAMVFVLCGWSRFRRLGASRAVWLALGNGVLIALHWFLFFHGARLGNVSNMLAGVATMALWVALLEPLFYRGRKIQGREITLGLMVVGGVIILAGSRDANLPSLLTGVAAAFVAAVFSLGNSRLVQKIPPLEMTGLEMLSACGCTAIVIASGLVPQGGGPLVPVGIDWLWIGILSLLCTVFAFSTCIWLQKSLSTFTIGLAANLEPIYGMILARICFPESEAMTARFYAGAAIIVGCVILHRSLSWRRPSP
jgi:drug/metabolite transporter (DMT)-like permease